MATASQALDQHPARLGDEGLAASGIDCDLRCDSLPQAALAAVFRGGSGGASTNFVSRLHPCGRMPPGSCRGTGWVPWRRRDSPDSPAGTQPATQAPRICSLDRIRYYRFPDQ
jgi:hypothetical protein